MNGLERDQLFVALTRPQMFAGVTYSYFIANAVIAVASVGLLMLTGRINWRYGATVILGCFILFGAASIVAGIQSTASLGR